MNRISKSSVVLAVLLLAAFALSIGAFAETGTTRVTAYVQARAHVHDFTFFANGNVLTAVCSNTDGKCDLPECRVSLTLIAPEDLDYDGNAKEAALSDAEMEAWTGAGLELPAIVYTAKPGSELTDGKPVLPGSYTAGITINGTTASVGFTITGKVESPVASPAAGTYTGTQHVTLSTVTEGASIYYTTDGTTPTAGSTRYTEPVTVDSSMTIRAIAIKNNWTDSDVTEASYTINIPVTRVEVFPESMIMKPGETRTISARITPDNATDKTLTVSMDQEGIVTIAEDGTVTALREGTVNVTFTASGGISGTCVITVRDDSIRYRIILGADQVVFTDAEQAVFASDADFIKFKCVKIDGLEIASRYFTAESGSTVITFNRDFISNKLKVGKHTIEIVSYDGSASAGFTVSKPMPPTGDDTQPVLLMMLALAGAGMFLMVLAGAGKKKFR